MIELPCGSKRSVPLYANFLLVFPPFLNYVTLFLAKPQIQLFQLFHVVTIQLFHVVAK